MTPGSIPSSADLREAMMSMAEWNPIGPSVLNAIVDCVEDVRRRVARRADVNPAALLIQFGHQMIAGTAPLDDLTAQETVMQGDGSGADCGDARMPPIDSPTAFGAAILGQLKASLAKGQSFSFLFLQGDRDDRGCFPPAMPAVPAQDDLAGQAHTATAIGYDDSQQAFMVVKRAGDGTQRHDFSDIMLLSYAYVTHPLLSQDVWTIRTVRLAN